MRARSPLLILAALGLLLAPRAAQAESPEGPAVGFLGVWDRAGPLLERASRETGVPIRVLEVTALCEDPATLSGLGCLFVLNILASHTAKLIATLEAARAERSLPVLTLDARGSHAPLLEAGVLTKDAEAPRYWRANGLKNAQRLLRYAAIRHLGAAGEVEPPVAIPDSGIYDPAYEDPFASAAAWERARRKDERWREGQPVVVMLIHQSFWITEDTAVIKAQLAALEARQLNPCAIFADSTARLTELVRGARPALLIEDRHGSSWEPELLAELDVPVLKPISMLAATIEAWRANPRGLEPRDVAHFLTLAEVKGTIEPIVVGGLKVQASGFRLHEPIPERIARFADRAQRWLTLRSKPTKDKRIAIIYYNKGLGGDDLMRGSPTGAFLDAPASLMRVLPRLAEAGWSIAKAPTDQAELLERLAARGRNLGPWAQGELEALADEGEPVLIPASRYREWYEARLDDAQRAAVEAAFGPPPGRLMVVRRNGEDHIVLPCVRLGNALLMPQPLRGETMDAALLHSRDVPPPHNYLAFYWWLQQGSGVDAALHWGTHGSLELQPGKEAGLSERCWSDICTGDLPVINPWIMDNLGEATLSRRRSYALLSDHPPPPAQAAGLDAAGLRRLHEEIHKLRSLEPGALREAFRGEVARQARDTGVAQTLRLDLAARLPTEDEVARIDAYLHELENETTPLSLHILGLPPAPDVLPSYIRDILGPELLEAIPIRPGDAPPPNGTANERRAWAAERADALISRCVLGEATIPPGLPEALREQLARGREVLGRIRACDAEVTRLLRALDGRFVPAGPGPDPVRNPSCLPGGRNLYALNPEEIPTRAAHEVAVALVEELIATRQPKKIGFDLNGMNTMRDFGVQEAQILHAIGVRPVWDANGLATELELIPREELGRRRLDVFVAIGGTYKENFPTRVALIDRAIRLAASAEEPDNALRAGTAAIAARLRERRWSEARIEALAPARIFGTKPGDLSGTNILYLTPRSGVWEDSDEIADVYIDAMSYVYTEGEWGVQIEGLYAEAIQEVDTIVRVWSSHMTSQLSNHHAYEYLGGLSMAVKRLTGETPRAVISDTRDPHAARVRDFEEVLATNLRSELLNPRWIRGMQAHGYAGAGHAAELVKNSFGWAVTRPGSIGPRLWRDIFATWFEDQHELGIEAWLERDNPHARQEMAAVLLEAIRKGHFDAEAATIDALARAYAESVAAHGPSNGLVSGGNAALDALVRERLLAPGDAGLAALAQRMDAAHAKAAGASAAPAAEAEESAEEVEHVVGRQLEAAEPGGGAASPSLAPALTVAAALALVGLGALWKRGEG